MWINRHLKNTITDELLKGEKIVVMYGARQTGKTSLIKKIIEEIKFRTVTVNADQLKYREVFSGLDLRKMLELVHGYDLLFIDEGQRIPELGLHLKILHDELPALRIIVTRSSSFDLAAKLSEPLTGRKRVFTLYPLSQRENNAFYNRFELKERLGNFLVYGSYPEVLTKDDQKEKFNALQEISESYIMKDIIEISQIKHIQKAYELLKLIAFQIGSEVSIHELSNSLKINHETVESYIGLFEKAFVIFRLGGFSRNLRNEISKSNKFFFWDLGIRNYLISNLNTLNNRNDIGQLFENFVISERLKKISYDRTLVNTYFWRLYSGAEVDYIEESQGTLTGYEIKSGKQKIRIPKSWTETYNSEVKLINMNNYLDFII